MTNFEKTRLTNRGIHLAASKGIEVTFTRVETGCGIYYIDEDVGNQEALKDKKQDYTINSIKREEDDQISLKFCMSNETLQQTYLFTEIGVYALDQDGNEILYAICFATPENAQKFVAYNGRFISSMFITLLFELSSESTAVFDVSGAYATYEDLQELAEETQHSIESVKKEMEELHGITLISTLSAGETTLILTDDSIKSDSTIDIYTDEYGVNPKNVSIENGSITLEFKANASDLNVKVVVS